MTMLELSSRDRRTLAVGVSVVAPLFILGKGLPAALAWQRARVSEAAVLRQQAADARGALRLVPVWHDSVRARAERLARFDARLLSGASPFAAAAALASSIGALADSAPMKVTSMQLRADSASRERLTTVSVRLTGIADVAGLAAFLQSVEGGDTLLLVRELSVNQPDPSAQDTKPEELRVDILVEALVRIVPAHA